MTSSNKSQFEVTTDFKDVLEPGHTHTWNANKSQGLHITAQSIASYAQENEGAFQECHGSAYATKAPKAPLQ
jgi:hypothetical protein